MKNKIFIISGLFLTFIPTIAFGVIISCPGCSIVGGSTCVAPHPNLYECSSQSYYDQRKTMLELQGMSETKATAQLQSCQDAINKYNADEQEYQTCLTNFNDSIKNLPVQPTCTTNQHYNSSTNFCDCNLGYIKQGDGSCACPSNSSNRVGSSSCYCNDGYTNYKGDCISYEQNCRLQYGNNSTYDFNKRGCYCLPGYEFNSSKTACVQITCYLNSSLINNQCVCKNGYINRNGSCISYTDDCIRMFGAHTVGVKGQSNNSSCDCENGFEWNSTQTACIKTIAPEPVKQASNPPPVEKNIEDNPTKPTTNVNDKNIDSSIQPQLGSSNINSPQTPQDKPVKKANIFLNIWNFIKNIFK